LRIFDKFFEKKKFEKNGHSTPNVMTVGVENYGLRQMAKPSADINKPHDRKKKK
jgi:hypothetical protein